MSYCQWVPRIDEKEEHLYGQDAVELARVARSGASVLPGFVVSTEAFADFFHQAALKRKLEKAGKGLHPRDTHLFAGASQEMRGAILDAALPAVLKKTLTTFLKELLDQAVQIPGKESRLEVTCFDSEGDTMAIQHCPSTFKELEKSLKLTYAMHFSASEVHDRFERNESLIGRPLAVQIAFLPEPEASGTASGRDSFQKDATILEIRASHSHHTKGEVLHRLEDVFRVDRKSFAILSHTHSEQWWAETEGGKFVSPKRKGKTAAVLSDDQVAQLARQVAMAQSAYPDPMSFAWVYNHRRFFITRVWPLETRPVSTRQSVGPLPLLAGQPGALGVVCGPVRRIATRADREKLQPGEIAVVEQLHSQDYHWLAGAAGVIAEVGRSHTPETRVAQRVGIPAVVGVGPALNALKDGQLVTIDGKAGTVLAGKRGGRQNAPRGLVSSATGTKVLSAIATPWEAESGAVELSDGIGSLRAEYVLRTLGLTPEQIYNRHWDAEYADLLVEGVSDLLQALSPRPVVYQLHDTPANSLVGLGYHRKHSDELHPKLGMRGTRRLLEHPELLELELTVLKRLRALGFTNLEVMLPMVRSLDEAEQALRRIYEGLDERIRVWVRCETPGLTILAEDLCQLDIAGIALDVPALAQLISGIDQANRRVGHHLDQADDAVIQAVDYAVSMARHAGVASMVLSEGEPVLPEVVQAAVGSGVTAVAMPPEYIADARHLVAGIEQRLMLDHILREHEERHLEY